LYLALTSTRLLIFDWCCFRHLILQPERIDPQSFGHGYDVRSDIWSLGIMLVGHMCVTWNSLLFCIILYVAFIVITTDLLHRNESVMYV